jgi:hypothetical protein
MYLHSIEYELAMAAPEYGKFRRTDALTVLCDSKGNLQYNGSYPDDEIPEIILLAGAFYEFYEGALGAYTTNTVFGPNTLTEIQYVAKLADAIDWTDLTTLLDQTQDSLQKYDPAVLDEYLKYNSADDDTYNTLLNLLVNNFEDMVTQDNADDAKMRRRANEWVQSQLDPSLCDDDKAMPILPGTISDARTRLGLDLPKPTLEEWRKELNAWQTKMSKPLTQNRKK